VAIRNPSFAAVVILTLGLGIGATTVVFSAVVAVLLNPLPFPHADGIVTLWMHDFLRGRIEMTLENVTRPFF
jgi:hypothetical protein